MRKNIFLCLIVILQIYAFNIKSLVETKSFCSYRIYPDENKEEVVFLIIPDRIYQFQTNHSEIKESYQGKLRGWHISAFIIPKNQKKSFTVNYNFRSNSRTKFSMKHDSFVQSKVSNYKYGIQFYTRENDNLYFPVFKFDPQREYYKLFIEKSGIYKIDQFQLNQAGINLYNIDPRTIKIETEGKEIPIYVSGENDKKFDSYDYIEFWAEENLNRYNSQQKEIFYDRDSKYNIYFLSYSKISGPNNYGKRLAIEEGSFSNQTNIFKPEYYQKCLHFEKDIYRNTLRYMTTINDPDLYFYSFIDKDQSSFIDFNLENIYSGSMKFKYNTIASLTSASYQEKYSILFSVNNNNFPIQSWKGASSQINTITGLDSFLKNGKNSLQLINLSDKERRIYLNWFEIISNYKFIANNNFIDCNQGAIDINGVYSSPRDKYYRFSISGFKDGEVSVYKKNYSIINNCHIKEVKSRASSSFTVSFEDYVADSTNYILVGESAKKIVPKITKQVVYKNSLYNKGNAADLLVIGSQEFLNSAELEKYLNWKAKNQFSTGRIMKIDIDQILLEFSNGEYSGYGLWSFFQYINENWSQAPQYIWLLGDSKYIHKNNPEGDIIPHLTFQHFRYGAVVSDYRFSTNKGSIYQFIIGRLPCRSVEELDSYLNKALQFQKKSELGIYDQKKLKELYILTDKTEYKYLKNSMKNYLPDFLFHDRMLLWKTTGPYQGRTATLLEKMDRGLGSLHYFGHGSGAIWANSGLLKPFHIDELLSNEYLPIVYTWSCFGGNFASYQDEDSDLGLTDKLLFTREKGAVAVIAASGNSQFTQNFDIFNKLLQNYQGSQTLGEHFYISNYQNYLKYLHMDNNTGRKNLFQYHILGDPSLLISRGSKKNLLTLKENIATYKQPINFTFKKDNNQSKFILGLYNSNNHLFDKLVISKDMISTQNTYTYTIPEEHIVDTIGNQEKYFTIKTFQYSNTENKGCYDCDTVHILQNNLKIIKLGTIPEYPKFQDSIKFYISLLDSLPIKNLVCMIDTNGTGDFNHKLIDYNKQGLTYTFKEPQKAQYRMQKMQYLFKIIRSNEDSLVTEPEEVIVPVADLYHGKYGLKYADSTDKKLETNIFLRFAKPYNREVVYDSVQVGIYEKDQLISQNYTSLHLSKHKIVDTARVEFSFNPKGKENNYLIKINNNKKHKEYLNGIPPFENNNLAVKFIKNHYFWDINYSDSLSIGSKNFKVKLAPGTFHYSKYIMQDSIYINNLKGLKSLLKTNNNNFGYRLQVLGAKTKILKPINIEINVDYTGNKKDILPMIFSETNQSWQLINNYQIVKFKNYYKIKFNTKIAGLFGVFSSTDNQGPKIEVSVEGQVFDNNSYVKKHPEFSVILEDHVGINIDSISIYMDNIPLKAEIRIENFNAEKGTVLLRFDPSLKQGSHTMNIRVKDNLGYSSSWKRDFFVASGFKIVYCGNYPNPFAFETVFCYKITDVAQQVKLQIFTVSGKLIREFSKNYVINYDEIFWDGRDSKGLMVANGVYFYKLIVKTRNKKYIKKGKMAKIRK